MRVIVLFSGGLDSTVLLWWARQKYRDVVALSIHYRGRPERERQAVHAILAQTHPPVRLIEIELPFYMDLTVWQQLGQLLPADLRSADVAYLPAKNLLFYSIAAYYAEILGARWILGGHYRDDPMRFPDVSRTYFARLNTLIRTGLWSHRPRLQMPFLRWDKATILRTGKALGAPLHLAWSCYGDGEQPCGACPGCHERARVAHLLETPS